jgi:hypothetical protein
MRLLASDASARSARLALDVFQDAQSGMIATTLEIEVAGVSE